ncbi:ABC transporter ATP-binding protein [uncultured Nevskia sp.]|uniref:ABC transporter ATP-binding protein n=1 Tax=uncultured Nevskia sp. TaxID=228950 RepID=UPI0025ED2B26|nr:ABC transporter ATP-binding protein [uncultured Nevskia sp.]
MKLVVDIRRKRHPGKAQDTIGRLAFSAESGEFVAIVGPSGAGKTTMLKIIAGLDKDYEGGLDGAGDDARLGFVFQEPRLLPWLNVADNLRLVSPALSDAEIDAGLAKVGLADTAAEFPLRLSGGMQRRVALLRAFLVRPELLLLDEPFISLDAPTAESLYQVLAELRSDVLPTTLLVTHDLREALALADRVLFVSHSPAQLILDYPIRLPKPRRRDDDAVSEMHHALIAQYPELLGGLGTVRPNKEAA